MRKLPAKPWPLTIGGLPIQFATDEFEESFQRGRPGRGPKCLNDIDLLRSSDLSDDLLKLAVELFEELKIKIRDIYYFSGFWHITVPDETEFQFLPFRIASRPAYYRTFSEAPDPDPAALRSKPASGVQFDDTKYTGAPDALLRPGIMLSSSLRTITKDGKTEETYKTTTSGILVANQNGEIFITVATHGFEDDGLVYHPDPHKGTVIGRIVDALSGTDISIAKLDAGLHYVNETFGTATEPNGVRLSGISPGYAPHLLAYDELFMNTPLNGGCEGSVLALGARVEGAIGKKYIRHEWVIFENGDQPVGESCGSPILDREGKVVGLFRYKVATSNSCVCVSAMELGEYGYDICGGEQTFR